MLYSFIHQLFSVFGIICFFHSCLLCLLSSNHILSWFSPDFLNGCPIIFSGFKGQKWSLLSKMFQIISSWKFYIAFCKAQLDIAYPFYKYIALSFHSTGSHHCTTPSHFPEDICHTIPPCDYHSWQVDLLKQVKARFTPTCRAKTSI